MKSQLVCLKLALALLALATLNFQLSTARAQNTTFTYQGRVLDNGTTFTGGGQFEFALVNSSNLNHTAFAVANYTGPTITSYNVFYGGNGYVTAPTVTVSGGGGSGATATAVLNGSSVQNIFPNNPGSGYTSPPQITVAAPPANILTTTYWSNDGTSLNGSEPATNVTVAVTNGLFTVVLGDTTVANMAAIPVSVFNQPGLQLQIWFNDGTHGFAPLNPAQNLTPAPYATYAANAATANSASNLLGNLPITQLTGTVPLAQLPAGVITNGASGVNLSGPVNVNNSTVIDANGVIYSLNGLIFENRTNDPAGPATGRIWLRTDL
jgi:hypothetical protein